MGTKIQLRLPRFLRPSHSDTPGHGTRRCLRYTRLERRLMLSGDFGEDYEIEDDDEYDDDDRYEIRDEHGENDESDFDDHRDSDHFHDTTIELSTKVDSAFTEIGSRTLGDSDSEDNDRNDDESPEQLEVVLANDETTDLVTDDLDSESDSSDSVQASASQSTITEPLADTEGVTRSTDDFGSRETPGSIGLQRALLGHDSSSVRGDPAWEDDQAVDADSTNESATNDASENESSATNLPANLQLRDDQQPRPQTHSDRADTRTQLASAADSTTGKDDDQYGIAAIPWMGSFADDLSAVDEALTTLLADTRSVAEASVGNLFQHGPLLTTGVVTSVLVAGTIYQRRRSLQSQLADDQYAVRFDVRLYPELFG